MNLRCKLLGHDMRPVAAKLEEPRDDVPIIIGLAPMTFVLFRCSRCGTSASTAMPGSWTLAELHGTDEVSELKRMVKL